MQLLHLPEGTVMENGCTLKGPVLVVDDDEQVANLVALTLQFEGIAQVCKISDSRLVMEHLCRAGASLILLDMVMPNLSGRELLPLIRQEFPYSGGDGDRTF